MFTHSSAEKCPKHDIALKFSIKQLDFPCFYVEISRIAKFRGIFFDNSGQQKTLFIKSFRNFHMFRSGNVS